MKKATIFLSLLAGLLLALAKVVTSSIEVAKQLPDLAHYSSMSLDALGWPPKVKVIIGSSIRIEFNALNEATPCAYEPDPDRKVVAGEPGEKNVVGRVVPPDPNNPKRFMLVAPYTQVCGTFVAQSGMNNGNSAADVYMIGYSVKR